MIGIISFFLGLILSCLSGGAFYFLINGAYTFAIQSAYGIVFFPFILFFVGGSFLFVGFAGVIMMYYSVQLIRGELH